jgi:SAM-dependent methyltransferase
MEAEAKLQPEREIVEVWERHPDEAYRRDISHWRGEGRWTQERWLALGKVTNRRLNDLFRAVRRRMADAAGRVVLEWGPGGGANVFALADWASLIYGVDISQANLDECMRIDHETRAGLFRPILLSSAEPAAATAQLERPVDVFISTAVFQHFPSKDYGRQVLDAVRGVMASDGLGYVQIRYDDGTPKYQPKPLSEYRRSHMTATSYGLAEFWNLLVDARFAPIKIANLNTRLNYASFYFAVAGPRPRPQ